MSKKIVKIFAFIILLTIIIPTSQAIILDKNQYKLSNLEGPTSPIISGPESGKTGMEYNFSFVSIDPSGFDLFYYIFWDDGNDDGWLGPYDSNISMNISHIWGEKGTYTIQAKAKNTNGTESEWSEHNITIEADVQLEIEEIVGGFLGITAAINNTGTSKATNVVGSVFIDEGMILIGKELTENIGTIEPGNFSGLYNLPMIGFGSITITITVKCNEIGQIKKKATGFILFFYVIVY